jgi:hypothetical protein
MSNFINFMMKYLITLLCFCLFSTYHFSLMAQETPFVEGQLIVQLAPGFRPGDVTKDCQLLNGKFLAMRSVKGLADSQNMYLFSYKTPGPDPEMVKNLVSNHPGVLFAQFNHYLSERILPNDPAIATQWHHVDASDNDIDSDLAWDITTGGFTANGDEIVVCVIENNGANFNHTDLQANHRINFGEIPLNGIDDDGNGYADDYNGWNVSTLNGTINAGGHGTSVSGMIGARGNNSIGGAGVNWNVKIMQVQLGSITEANAIAAYEYAYDMRNLYNTTNGAQGAFIVATNASWGIDNANPVNYPAWCAMYEALGEVGVLNCGATANNNVNIDVVGDMPTACTSDYMIAVTATNSSDVRTFSGYGINSIDLGAPGESVYLPSGSTNYSFTSGTSFASPCVAGAIALMYAAPCNYLADLSLSNPQQAADLVRQHLLDGVDPVANLAAEVATGGRLNVKNSIDLLLANCGPQAPCQHVDVSQITSCVYNELTAQTEAQAVLSFVMSAEYCQVSQICWRELGAPNYTCINPADEGLVINNLNNTYTIEGLLSNQVYEYYYATGDYALLPLQFTTPDCSGLIPGCLDPDALNFDPGAEVNDGSCEYPCVNVNFELLTDCWGEEVSWQITDEQNTIIASSPINTYGDLLNYNWNSCIATGCYTLQLFDSFGDGMAGALYGECGVNGNYVLTDQYGNVLAQMGAANYGPAVAHPFCVEYVVISGCTDPAACNYSPGANNDDGSCEYNSCVGCTNPFADNYSPLATTDDGSCILSCTEVNFTLTADCFASESSWNITNDQGQVVASSPQGAYTLPYGVYSHDLCLENGCYTLSVFDSWSDGLAGSLSGCAFDGDYSLSDAQGNVLAEMTVANFGALAQHGFCVELQIAGCTDAAACNYDPAANVDNGLCDYSCLCPGDFNNDLLVNTGDLLLLLSEFGCTENCATDMDNSGVIDTNDLLGFLTYYGIDCTQ